eukprot:comp7273_c0_seq1/m.2977 comp7273_c0_seq1/g.2977  ORF comp7273_c0_seq1/g.2977 comp7273_c0_seq1/m.2977 type:complete len:463 (-) comp7273_c0_seq1:160-1548(-)
MAVVFAQSMLATRTRVRVATALGAAAQQRRWLSAVKVNEKYYHLPLAGRPVVGICLDGTSMAYITEARNAGAMPNWSKLVDVETRRGFEGLATTIMPTFTNPNHVSIITGVESNVHGICGNYFVDEETGQEVMMNDPKYLRCETILQKLNQAGARVGVVTAKDKLLKLLSNGLAPESSFTVSVEKAAEGQSLASLRANRFLSLEAFMGVKAPPSIYDPEISIYALHMGLRWLQSLDPTKRQQPTVLYVSTTDYVQHKHRPGSPEANDFYWHVDQVIGEFDRLGAVVGLTADHGMNDKINYDGTPNVRYLESELKAAGIDAKVVCPITDPYVVHHGALGSYATIYLKDKPPATEARALEVLRGLRGIETALSRKAALTGFNLPSDRIGDLVVCGDRDTVVGRTPEAHDLSQLGGVPLRSHGGMEESAVPMLISRPLQTEYSRRLGRGMARNYHLFDFLCNGVA